MNIPFVSRTNIRVGKKVVFFDLSSLRKVLVAREQGEKPKGSHGIWNTLMAWRRPSTTLSIWNPNPTFGPKYSYRSAMVYHELLNGIP